MHRLRFLAGTDTLGRDLLTRTLVAGRLSNKEIAAKMDCSVKTIKNHLNAIFQKLEVSNRTEAVVKGIEMGLISPEERSV